MQIRSAVSEIGTAKSAADEYLTLTKYRYYYGELMAELRRCLIATEQKQKAAMEADFKKAGRGQKGGRGGLDRDFQPDPARGQRLLCRGGRGAAERAR